MGRRAVGTVVEGSKAGRSRIAGRMEAGHRRMPASWVMLSKDWKMSSLATW